MTIYVVLETDNQPDYNDSIVRAFKDRARAQAFADAKTKASKESGRILPLIYEVEEVEFDDAEPWEA